MNCFQLKFRLQESASNPSKSNWKCQIVWEWVADLYRKKKYGFADRVLHFGCCSWFTFFWHIGRFIHYTLSSVPISVLFGESSDIFFYSLFVIRHSKEIVVRSIFINGGVLEFDQDLQMFSNAYANGIGKIEGM